MTVSSNPLVATRVDTTSPFAGTGILEDGLGLADAIRNGDWLAGGLGALAVGLDVAAAVVDPLGTLLAGPFGWLIDHVPPLNTWLEELTGDADGVRANAATWHNVAAQLGGVAEEIARAVERDLEAMRGEFAEAYRAFQADIVAHLRLIAGFADTLGTAMEFAAALVQVVHDVVRDAIAQVLGAVASYAVELVCTAGLATPVVIAQAETRGAALAAKVGAKVAHLKSSMHGLDALLTKLRAIWEKLAELVRNLLPGGTTATAAAVVVPRKPPTARPKPATANTVPEALSFGSRAAAREGLPGDLAAAGNRFFRGATSKSRDFKATGLPDGGYRLEFFSPANNPGYGKLYVQEIDRTGQVLREYKNTMGPDGLIETKWVHGGP